jgi:aldehyde dehydrogenase (NAD+)
MISIRPFGISNDSDHGLSGVVFSRDKERGLRVACCIAHGSVSINGGMCIAGDLSFGGYYKSSGIGREWGLEGIEEYPETKTMESQPDVRSAHLDEI